MTFQCTQFNSELIEILIDRKLWDFQKMFVVNDPPETPSSKSSSPVLEIERPSESLVSKVKNKTMVYSKKVFLGGLPPDVDDVHIMRTFASFNPMYVDWPGKTSCVPATFPPKGFAFLYFSGENAVHRLIEACLTKEGRLYYPMSSFSTSNKLIEVKPWRIRDSKTILDPRLYVSPGYSVFVGGIPRPMTSGELAEILDKRFGNVGYVAIFLDSRTNYPRGSGMVVFTNTDSYAAAVAQHYVLVDQKFRCVELKPYSWHGAGYKRLNSITPVSRYEQEVEAAPESDANLKFQLQYSNSIWNPVN